MIIPGNTVKLDKLVNQLRRDLLANRKKAAILGLMLLVALYFWAPLVGKFLFPAGGTKKTAAGQTALILEDDPLEPTAQNKSGKAKPFHWEKIRQLMQKDQFMVPAALEPGWPDPFLSRPSKTNPELPTETDPDEATVATQSSADVTPALAGLKLASVAIGPRRRAATINGDTYREGAVIRIGGKDSKGPPLEFRLVRIEREQVEIEHNGKTYKLELERPKLAQGDEIQRGGQGQRD